MTDKKFTDEEIIKALEGSILNAKGCDSKVWSIEIYRLESALDLINRQKVEIERLKSQCENTQIGYNFLKSDFERLKGSTIVNNIMEIQRIKRDAKAEAYKTFAEKLKEEFLNLQYNAKTDRKNVKIEELKEQMDWLLHTVAIETVENLLKEMVGE